MHADSHFVDYLRDHLAGAEFAISLLDDLLEHAESWEALMLGALRSEIELDRSVLTEVLAGFQADGSSLKTLVSKIAEKVARAKLSVTTALGRFEAIELLSLGVLGKLALWYTIAEIAPEKPLLRTIPLSELIPRARSQHERLEHLRLKLAREAFLEQPAHA